MNKKLQSEIKIALKKSIKHWQKDIINRFEKGDRAYWNICLLQWISDDSLVKCYNKSCALCTLFYRNRCNKCPYYIYYGNSYEIGHWGKFSKKPTKRNAIAMCDSLQQILNNWDKFVKKYEASYE